MMFEISLELVRAIPFPDWIKPEAFAIGPLSVKWYGISYILGLFGAYYYANRSSANQSIWQHNKATGEPVLVPNKRMLEDLMFFSLIGIIVGGRIGFILLYGLGDYIKDPVRIFKVWEGGMAFHGGFLGVCVAAIYLAKSRKLRLMRVADILAISAPIGLFLVRLANFVNQELYGRVADVPWAFIFTQNGFPLSPRHPSQLYEAFLEGAVIFSVLWFASRNFKILTKPGLATGMFLAMYGSFRIFVEFFREPDATLFGPLTRGMTYSLPMVIIGILVIIWAAKRAPVVSEWPPADEDDKANA
jgi:phosphatidylglycerol---prolipoprotein diacylglyceryl transferase